MKYVSRGGEKLEFALSFFNINPQNLICADFGSSAGGFVDCLLQQGAKKVYAVESGYGLLDWKLRNDERVVVMEKTNAMYIELPEKVDLITIDTGWTKQTSILPSAYRNLKDGGRVISLVKISFEAGFEKKIKFSPPKGQDVVADLNLYQKTTGQQNGTLPDNKYVLNLLDKIKAQAKKVGFAYINQTPCPILGKKGKNLEYFMLLGKMV